MSVTIEELQVEVTAKPEQFKSQFAKLNQLLKQLETTATSAGAGIENKLFPSMLKANLVSSLVSKSFGLLNTSLRSFENIIKGSIKSTQTYENALIGLESVAGRKLGMEAIPLATKAAKDLASDGLMSVSDAATGLKNLLASGFNLEEATNLMNTFRNSAAFGRQGSLSFGEAVRTATEGIKNGNSVLVDNAGITKNLSNILVEAGYSQQDLSKATTDASVRQALYNGLLKEGALFQGDAAKMAQTTSGQLATIGATMTNLKVTIGQFIKPIQSVVQTAFGSLLGGISAALGATEGGIKGFANRVAGYLLAMFRVLGQLLSRLPIVGKYFQGLANLKLGGGNKGIGGIADQAGSFADNADSATGSAKKLKKELMGLASFDEMNVLNSNEDTGDSGSGAAAPIANVGGLGDVGGGDLGLGDSTEQINKFADDATAKFNKFGDGIKKVIDTMKDFKPFGIPVFETMEKIAKAALKAGVAFWGLSTVFRIIKSVLPISMFLQLGSLLAPIGAAIASFIGLIPAIASFGDLGAAIALTFGTLISPITAAAAVVAALVAGFVLLYTQSEGFRNIVNSIFESIIGAVPKVIELIEPLANAIGNILGKAFEFLGNIVGLVWGNIFKPFVDFLIAVAGPAFKLIGSVVGIIIGVMVELATTILNALAPAFDILGGIAEIVFTAIGAVVKTFFFIATEVFTGIFNFINNNIIPIVQRLSGIFHAVFTAIGSVVATAWGLIRGAIQSVLDWMESNIMPVINRVKDEFTGAFEKVKETVMKIWESIKQGIKDGINGIIDLLNNAFGKINGLIKSLNKVPGVNIGEIGTIPKLAKGGDVNESILANIGEKGREAVVPLENNTGWAETFIDILDKKGGVGGKEPIHLVVNVGGEKMVDQVIEGINDRSLASNGLVINI